MECGKCGGEIQKSERYCRICGARNEGGTPCVPVATKSYRIPSQRRRPNLLRWLIPAGIGSLLIAGAIVYFSGALEQQPVYGPPPGVVEAAQRAMTGYTDDTKMVFADPTVEILICKTLGKEKGSVTVRDMRGIKSFKYPGDEDIDFTNTHPIRTLEDLRYCDNLEILWAEMQPIDSIKCLRNLRNIVSIDLRGCHITDYSPLAKMESLGALAIGDISINTIDLSSLTTSRLEYIYCFSSKLRDISLLLRQKELKTINLNQVDNEQFASLLKSNRKLNMITLDKSRIRFSSFAFLGDEVTFLSICRSTITSDVSTLSCPNSLEYLLLGGNNMKDITPLAGCTNLRTLNLSSNKIKDISPLAGCSNLKDLALDNNMIKDISPLAGCSSLKILSLDSNEVVDISPLTRCSNLKDLSLNNNINVDISSLAGCTSLKILHLQNNNIKDTSPLAGCFNLVDLDLENNSIENISPLVALQSLINLNIEHNGPMDFSPLLEIKSLKSLQTNRYADEDDKVLKQLSKQGCNVNNGVTVHAGN